MALQHLDGSARRVVLPEALARFSHDVAATQRSPLRAMTYVALGIDTLMILASMMVGFLVRSTGQYPLAAATAILVVWLGMLALTRISSLAGMSAAIAAPIAAWALGYPWHIKALAAIAVAVLVLHRANIARLRAGTEPKVGGQS